MTVEERVASLEARVSANERAADRANLVGEKAMERADQVLTKRFDAANEIRESMRDQTRQFVTRSEFQWAMGAVVLVLIGMILRVLIT